MELIIDTSTRFASVAVAKESEIVGSSSWESERNHSVELVPSINTLLSRLKITTDQIESVYITVGPGRFSALRVGISTAKSFAKTREIPLVPLNTLEVEAIPYIHLGLPTYALIGAGKSKVYSARYPEGSINQNSGVYLVESHSEIGNSVEQQTLFCGEGVPEVSDIIKDRVGKNAVFAETTLPSRQPQVMSKLGYDLTLSGKIADPDSLQPIYMKANQILSANRQKKEI